MNINPNRELQEKVIERLVSIRDRDEIRSLLLFGSAARGEMQEHSDIDAIFIVVDGHGTRHLQHTYIKGIKLDVSFNTFEQFVALTEEQIASGDRIPMICESKILFDKDGALLKFKKSLSDIVPGDLNPDERKFQLFMVSHLNTKMRRFVEDGDLVQAELVMHYALSDLLKRHYRLHKKWRVSDKRLLSDLREWDLVMAELVGSFVSEHDTLKKFEIWKQMVRKVSAGIDMANTASVSCDCETCRSNMAMLGE